MDVKVVTAYNSKSEFEKKIMEMIEKGYKIHSSTVMPATIGTSVSLKIREQRVWFYALMVKE